MFSAVLGSAQGPFDTLDALCEELYERDRTQPPFDGACELQGEWLGEGLRWGVIHASFEIGYATVYLVLRADAGFFVGAELGFIEEDSRTEQGWVGDIEAVAVDLIDGAPEELTLVWSSGSGFENGCHWRTSARRRALVCAAVEAGAGCFATMDLGPVTYEGQGMAPIAVSLGECEPDDDFADVSENDDAPSYTVSFEPGRITVGGGGGSDDPRVGTHSAVRAFCGLRSAPSSLSCAN